MISVYAVGTDGVDVAAAQARGIVVANVPDYCAIDVAEHTIALILAAWRRLPVAQRVARSGHWGLDDLRPLHRLHGRTLGLLGYGRIAREVAARAGALGLQVLAHDPYVAAATAAGDGVGLRDRDELLRASDVLSIHLPSTPETAGSVDAAALALLPRGAVVINAGRGAVLDEDALLRRPARGPGRRRRPRRPAPRARAGRPSAARAGERRLHAAHGVLQRGVAARPAPRRRPERAHRARGWRPRDRRGVTMHVHRPARTLGRRRR